MDQKKNESIVPSITQLEDFLIEHNSNVVWLLVGKGNVFSYTLLVFVDGITTVTF